MLKCYLGGGIRRSEDNEVDERDSSWRLLSSSQFAAYQIGSFDPLIANADVVDHWKKDNFDWTPEMTKAVYDNDVKGMNECQVGVFDLRSLDDDYPNQGSIFEIGYLTAQGKYVIIATDNESIRANPMFAGCEFVQSPEQFLSRVLPYMKEFSDNIWSTLPISIQGGYDFYEPWWAPAGYSRGLYVKRIEDSGTEEEARGKELFITC